METKSEAQDKPPKKLLRIILPILLVLAVVGVYFYQHYSDTGLFPIPALNKSESILPPEIHPTEQTYEQVMSFIVSDDTDTIGYGEGFNCVDASFRLCLNARWQGIAAYLIRINYEDSPTHHMVVAFPTADRGDLVVEPQGDIQVRPRIGRSYDGKIVDGLYILQMSWVPIEGSPALDPGYEIE